MIGENTNTPLFELRAVIFVNETTAKAIQDGGLVSITFSGENSEVTVSGKVCGISELKSMDVYAIQII